MSLIRTHWATRANAPFSDTETRKLTPAEMEYIGMGEPPRPTQAQHSAEAALLNAMAIYTRSLSLDRIAAAIATAAIARWGAARTEKLGELISRAAHMEGRK